jgi:membrane protein YqaA with SNARE-associated domain
MYSRQQFCISQSANMGRETQNQQQRLVLTFLQKLILSFTSFSSTLFLPFPSENFQD